MGAEAKRKSINFSMTEFQIDRFAFSRRNAHCMSASAFFSFRSHSSSFRSNRNEKTLYLKQWIKPILCFVACWRVRRAIHFSIPIHLKWYRVRCLAIKHPVNWITCCSKAPVANDERTNKLHFCANSLSVLFSRFCCFHGAQRRTRMSSHAVHASLCQPIHRVTFNSRKRAKRNLIEMISILFSSMCQINRKANLFLARCIRHGWTHDTVWSTMILRVRLRDQIGDQMNTSIRKFHWKFWEL